MKMKRTASGIVFDGFNYSLMVLIAFLTLYPFWHLLVQSVLPYEEAIKSNFYLIPRKVTFEAYQYVFTNFQFFRSLVISVGVTVLGILYQLLITCMAAYSLTKKNLPGRNFLLFFIVFTMFFGGGLIPYYLLIKNLNLVGSLWVMVLPFAVNTFYLIIVKTSFSSLPVELEEAAFIDGAGYYRCFFRIVLPLSIPMLSTIGLSIAVGQWNNWFTPMLFLNERQDWPLALLLRDILVVNNTDFVRNGGMQPQRQLLSNSIKAAVAIVSILPIVAVYPFIQKYFVKGVMIGAVKS